MDIILTKRLSKHTTYEHIFQVGKQTLNMHLFMFFIDLSIMF